MENQLLLSYYHLNLPLNWIHYNLHELSHVLQSLPMFILKIRKAFLSRLGLIFFELDKMHLRQSMTSIFHVDLCQLVLERGSCTCEGVAWIKIIELNLNVKDRANCSWFDVEYILCSSLYSWKNYDPIESTLIPHILHLESCICKYLTIYPLLSLIRPILWDLASWMYWELDSHSPYWSVYTRYLYQKESTFVAYVNNKLIFQ